MRQRISDQLWANRFKCCCCCCLFVKSSWLFRRRQLQPTPVLLPGKSHGRRSLVGCSPWGHEESDTTEWLHFHFSLSCTGEGNGNLLHCSCLENPRDGRAWWAAVYGVTQSQTRLKWLSSSSKLSQHKQIGVMNREYAKASGPLFKDTFNIFLTLFCAIALF